MVADAGAGKETGEAANAYPATMPETGKPDAAHRVPGPANPDTDDENTQQIARKEKKPRFVG
jgi:hypothetical protein